jgi:hypothetical protein
VECQVSQRKSNPLRGKEDEVIEITNRKEGKQIVTQVSQVHIFPSSSFSINQKDLNCKGIFSCASCRLFYEVLMNEKPLLAKIFGDKLKF